MLRYLPNALTISRLLLALPLGYVILQQDYGTALWVGFVAGLTDALDGFAARRLNSYSQLGAAIDPIADKVLVTVAFLCLAWVDLVPWYLAATVITRDLVIVTGAACYRLFIGPFEFGASRLSKANMVVQIVFCVALLAAQVGAPLPEPVFLAGCIAVFAIAVVSGLDYVVTWTRRAMRERGERD